MPTDTYATPEPPIVAVVYDDAGQVVDRCWTWETGQNYALHEGYRVEAVADDGHMTMARAQSLYDAERAAHIDCWGGALHAREAI